MGYIYRTFGVKCSGCDDSIYPSDLVRRIAQRIFHLSCLKCSQCKAEANTGDQIYLLDDGRFFCKTDYEQLILKPEEAKINEGLLFLVILKMPILTGFSAPYQLHQITTTFAQY